MTEHSALHLAVIEQSERYLLPLYKRADVVLTSGEGVWVTDANGRRYLDGLAGIAVNALGYGDPDVVTAIQQAATGLLHTSGLFYTAPMGQLAERLVTLTPWAQQAFLCNSGAEAIEAALKFARRRSYNRAPGQQTAVVACEHAFHGRTLGALSLTAREAYRIPFMPLIPDVRFMPFNGSAAEVARYIDAQVGVVILEPIQGEGGVRVAEAEFLRAVRERCDAVGATLIFDEIQCGLGRTGDVWAHTSSGVVPDVMALAKPLGGGLPAGAVLVNAEVAGALHAGDHGTTFGGNPFVAAVANTVLAKVTAPTFLEQVRHTGSVLGGALRDLGERFAEVSDVRGRGLMWGVELAGYAAGPVVSAALDQGLLLAAAGPDVVRVVPPLVLGVDEAIELVQRLGRALEAVFQS